MLSKIFGFKQKKNNKTVRLSDSNDDSWLEDFHITERGLPNLERHQVRVLVFKDHDKKGDKCVLFDSKTACRVETQQDAENAKPLRRRPSSDVPLLGEMIFGSVEMTYKGPTVKAHSIRTPPQLLLTKVFALKAHRASHTSPGTQSITDDLQTSNKFSESTSELSVSLQQSQGFADHQMAKSVPVYASDLCSPACHTFQLHNVAEGFSSSMSGSNSFLNATLPTTSSGSYQRRLRRSQETSIDYGCQKRNELFNEEMSMRLRRRPKIGVGILFSLWEGKDTSEQNNRLFQSFCFSHFPVIESHVHRLKRKIERALLTSLQMSGTSFQDALLNATNSFTDSILQLYYAPRIRSPVWLTMLSQPDQCDHICEDFVPQLVNVIKTYNTKETHFFMSSLLTAVLTYHVAWVTTVTPSTVQARRAYLDKHSSELLNVLGVSHPYNPLWAQLSDLYGAVGEPTKTARTMIVGKDKHLVTILLHILSYFIRCSEVYERTAEQTPDFINQDDLRPGEKEQNRKTSVQEHPTAEKALGSISEISTEVFDNFVEVTHEDADESTPARGESVDSYSKACDQCSEVDVKDCVLDDHRTFESCSCNAFTKNSKENKLWKSFLKTSCRDRTCTNLGKETKECYPCSNNIGKESKDCYPCSKSVTLDDSWLTKNRELPTSVTTNPVKLSRRHSSENKSESLDYQNNMFCIQNDGKRFSLDRHSIVNMFQSSFPLCPICKGRLSFSEKDFISLKNSQSGGLQCGDCEKHKCCSCEMVNCEFNGNNGNKFGSSVTISSSEGYSSGISLFSSDTEIQDSLDTLSIDSGVNVQSSDAGINTSVRTQPPCDQKKRTEQGKCSTVIQPHMLEIPEFGNVNVNQNEHSANQLDCQLFSFGRSLMAGYCDRYLPDFVLHGTTECTDEDIKYDLKISLEQPVIDSPILESFMILGDTDTWECKVTSLRKPKKGLLHCTTGRHCEKNEYSNLVHSFLTSFRDLWEMNMSAQFCLMHLEDKMKEIYLRSKVISEYLLTQKKYITMNDLMSTFGYSECDLALLMSVVGVHSPLAVSRIPLL